MSLSMTERIDTFRIYSQDIRVCVCFALCQSLPFVEYELHKQLVNKLKMKSMNSLFRLKIQISVGVTQLVAVAVSHCSQTQSQGAGT